MINVRSPLQINHNHMQEALKSILDLKKSFKNIVLPQEITFLLLNIYNCTLNRINENINYFCKGCVNVYIYRKMSKRKKVQNIEF